MPDPCILEGRHRMVVGGGIGAGKSTVTTLLGERGALVVAADQIGHQVLAPGGPAFPEIARRWPDTVVEGHIDRARLASVVFGDPAQLAILESITHPAIEAEIRVRVEAAGDLPVVVELPILAPLVGDGWVHIWVATSLESRLTRTTARGFDRRDAERRAAAQPDDAAWEAWADHVLANRGTLRELADEVDRLVVALNRGLERLHPGPSR